MATKKTVKKISSKKQEVGKPDPRLDMDSPEWCPVAWAAAKRAEGDQGGQARRAEAIAFQDAVGSFSEVEQD